MNIYPLFFSFLFIVLWLQLRCISTTQTTKTYALLLLGRNSRRRLLLDDMTLSQDPLPHSDGACDNDGAIEIDGAPEGAPDGALDGAMEIDGAPDGAPLGARDGINETDGAAVGPDPLPLPPSPELFFKRRARRLRSTTTASTSSMSNNADDPRPLAPRTSNSFCSC